MAKTADTAVGKSVEDRVAALEASTDKVWATVRKVVKVLEKMFGVDIDRDGKVGGVRVGVLVTFAVVCAAGLASAGMVWDLSSTSQGTLKAESTSKQITLTVDKLVVTNTISLAAGSLSAAALTGNIAVARLTNALPSAGSYIGGNIPAAALTNTVLSAIAAQGGKTFTLTNVVYEGGAKTGNVVFTSGTLQTAP